MQTQAGTQLLSFFQPSFFEPPRQGSLAWCHDHALNLSAWDAAELSGIVILCRSTRYRCRELLHCNFGNAVGDYGFCSSDFNRSGDVQYRRGGCENEAVASKVRMVFWRFRLFSLLEHPKVCMRVTTYPVMMGFAFKGRCSMMQVRQNTRIETNGMTS